MKTPVNELAECTFSFTFMADYSNVSGIDICNKHFIIAVRVSHHFIRRVSDHFPLKKCF